MIEMITNENKTDINECNHDEYRKHEQKSYRKLDEIKW